tara:strand:- start:56652 stop:57089 length:438 start_codon:yes stop_codon:yes gene_type:complete
MSLYETLRSRIIECVKSGNKEERDILKTLVGEIQSKAISTGKEPTDEMVEKTLKSFKENAEECCTYSPTSAYGEHIAEELRIYDNYLPTYETVESIEQLLSPIVGKLKAAKADGPATGMAMGMLKKSGKKIQGQDVSEAVKRIRS